MSDDGLIEFVRKADPAGVLGETLPLPRATVRTHLEPDWRKVTPPPRFEPRPPEGAPNVVIVLMDQLSYADP